MTYLQLLWSFIQIGLFSIGGGYAALPLIEEQVVNIHSWLTIAEFTDLITIAEMTPGPLAINSATFVGSGISGFGGALIATLGCILPSCFFVALLGFLYFKYKKLAVMQDIFSGLRPAVVSLIASAALSIVLLSFWGSSDISIGTTDITAVIIFAVSLFLIRNLKLSPVLVMLGCGVLGGAVYYILGIQFDIIKI